ncbi:MAG: SusD/RagB family nutrient-binding outer membrane lipoprotein [Tannerellaceae bacterium]|nr:SusD/RagB family nutrient-binding outer membrane lipoprotein [Tannerellaceae bacterium]
MKKISHIISILLTACILLPGCTSSFDDLNSNPDKPVHVTSSMLATTLILSMKEPTNYWKNEFLAKRMFWGEQMDNFQYNRIGAGSFEDLRLIINAEKMLEYSSEADLDGYTGLYYFMKGWCFYRTSMKMGDIPYTQALNVEEYPYPAYDSQKEVFTYVLEDLAKAEEYFAKTTGTIDGDPFLNGNPDSWRKATNVLRLKVLMALQKRVEDTPELKIKETFSRIVAAGPLFTGNEDNLQVVYSEKAGQMNPYHNNTTRSIEVYAGSTVIIDPLKEYGDYRLFYYFAPAQALTDPVYLPEGQTLLQPDDWEAYNGLDVAAPFDQEQKKISIYMHNRPNDVYRLSYTGVPNIILGYADMNFVLAEAAERGWISGPAKQYYEEGIRASFDFVRNTVPEEYNNGVNITDEYISAYLRGAHVAYKENGSMTERLQQIWMQSYLAGYFHMTWDAYFDYRRTGYPVYPVNPETNLNDEKNKIPMRWMYPERENSYNKDQLYQALRNQWGAESDDVNNIMWILK